MSAKVLLALSPVVGDGQHNRLTDAVVQLLCSCGLQGRIMGVAEHGFGLLHQFKTVHMGISSLWVYYLQIAWDQFSRPAMAAPASVVSSHSRNSV